MGSCYETLGRENVMPLAHVRTVWRQNVSVRCKGIYRDNTYRERANSVSLVGRLFMTEDKRNTAT